MTNESEAAKAVHIAEELLDEIRLQRLELATVNKCLAKLETEHQAMSMALTKLCKRVSHLGPDLQAVLRMLHLNPEALPYPQRLMVQRYRLKSQNEEDGITLALFEQVGTINRQFIEIGSGLSGGNSALLASELGWTGLMLDGDTERMVQVGRRFPNVRAVGAWVTRENINDLIADAGLGGEIDFVSIDLDGNDYWVWEALTACSPRVVVVEYNSAFGAERAVTIPYDPQFDRHKYRFVYYGASLAALARLGAAKGYRLVTTEPAGVNAYFLRNDVGLEIPACSPENAFRLLRRYDVWMRTKQEDIYKYVASAKLPLVEFEV
ncbi:MAG: hypothetical protein VX453_02070 [Acidobacteriota bacterium]|nr:hypothetical protein [Acidobacteriota bacterium]